MTRKRRISDDDNNNESNTTPKAKRIRTSEQRLISQLQSDFTDKMIIPLASPEGQLTSRSGRKINKVDIRSPPTKKSMSSPAAAKAAAAAAEQSNKPSKRKVRKPFSIHNINAWLRFVSNLNRQSSVFTKSPIQKLISVNKIGLNNDHFQTQLNDKNVSTTQPIIDLCTEMSAYDTNCVIQVEEKMEPNEPNVGTETEQLAIDYECDLKTFHLLRARADSIQIIDEVDLTSSTDGSENGDVEKINNNEPVRLTPISFPKSEADSTSLSPKTSPIKTDLPKSVEIINIANPISDCAISTSGSDAISVNDKPFSECTSDDCVIADSSDSDSTENWHNGQIVWAALQSFPFWPAVIFNCTEENTFKKGKILFFKKMASKYKYLTIAHECCSLFIDYC